MDDRRSIERRDVRSYGRTLNALVAEARLAFRNSYRDILVPIVLDRTQGDYQTNRGRRLELRESMVIKFYGRFLAERYV
jgi:hypothetical protein